MDIIAERVAGLDIGKEEVVAAVRTPGEGSRRRQEIRTFATFTASLEGLTEWLAAEGVSQVVMEATGQYWKPVVRHEALFDRVGMKGPHLRAVAAAR